MLLNILSRGFTARDIPLILLRIPIILIALTVHEVAHGKAALWMGDTTARDMGRLSLNPFRHIDPIGAIVMLIFGFGWAKPVPINARRFKNPKTGMALSALAGPASNLILAFFGLVLLRLLYVVLPNEISPGFPFYLITTTILFLMMFASMNMALAIFNLLPVPPLDGSRILFGFLPNKLYFGIMRYERFIAAGIMVLLFLGVLDKPLTFLISGALRGMGSLLGLKNLLW
ncbi:MAG TPA: site-2 protease family protein [Clostridiales bacterium]|nr:site-2 protease family protein [Clostridiales bacterium]